MTCAAPSKLTIESLGREVTFRDQAAKERTYVIEQRDELCYRWPHRRKGEPRPRNPIASYTVRRWSAKRSDKVVQGVTASLGRWSAWGRDRPSALRALITILNNGGR